MTEVDPDGPSLGRVVDHTVVKTGMVPAGDVIAHHPASDVSFGLAEPIVADGAPDALMEHLKPPNFTRRPFGSTVPTVVLKSDLKNNVVAPVVFCHI